MGEMKPTPGPWIAVKYSAKRFGLGTAGDGAWMYLQTIYQDADHPEMRANARLIAEAGTVFHNTGLSPVQLVEQRDELIAACKKLVEWDAREKDHAISFMDRIHLCDEAFQMMRAALAKCEGVGNG